MIHMNALKSALAVLGRVGRGELTIDVDGTPVTMRAITADEDMAANHYARTAEDGEEVEGLVFLERYKRTVLAHAIVQIGDLDLRAVEEVQTEDVTDSGIPIVVPRYMAVRRIIDQWARVTTLALFQKYLELSRRVDAAAEMSIKFDVMDIDMEIKRVEKRLAELQYEKERQDSMIRSGGLASALGAAEIKIREQDADVVRAASGPVNTAPAPESKVRQRVTPQSVPPPSLPPRLPEPVVNHQPVDPTTSRSSFSEIQDSLGDGPDQMQAEMARLQAARQSARAQSVQVAVEEPPVIQAPSGAPVPPHRQAANVADAVFDPGDVMRSARPASSPDEREGVRLGSATLTDVGKKPAIAKNQPVSVNVDPNSKGPTNPRFNQPRR